MFLATIEGQSGDPPVRKWKANSRGQCRIYEAAPCREALAMVPRAPLSWRVCV